MNDQRIELPILDRLAVVLDGRLEDLATSPNWAMSITEFYEWQRTGRLLHVKTVRSINDAFAAACQDCDIFGEKYNEAYMYFFGETPEEGAARWRG